MPVSNSNTPAVLLLAPFSVTTTQREKFEYWNSIPYIDTPRSDWEAVNVAAARIAGWMRGKVK